MAKLCLNFFYFSSQINGKKNCKRLWISFFFCQQLAGTCSSGPSFAGTKTVLWPPVFSPLLPESWAGFTYIFVQVSLQRLMIVIWLFEFSTEPVVLSKCILIIIFIIQLFKEVKEAKDAALVQHFPPESKWKAMVLRMLQYVLFGRRKQSLCRLGSSRHATAPRRSVQRWAALCKYYQNADCTSSFMSDVVGCGGLCLCLWFPFISRSFYLVAAVFVSFVRAF